MTHFTNTTDWVRKSGSEILYTYEHEGKRREGTLEKQPLVLHLSADSVSVLETVRWTRPDREHPGGVASFRAAERIQIKGKLERSRIHVFTIGEASTATCDQMEVSIYPCTPETLQASSTYDQWSIHQAAEKPDEGWLTTEHGRLAFYEANEYFDRAVLSGSLWLDSVTFSRLSDQIRSGANFAGVRLEILADLYQFGWEGFVSSALSTSNYGLLREPSGKSFNAITKARLEEVGLDWTVHHRSMVPADGPESDATPTADTRLRTASSLSSNVQHIRSRVDLLSAVLTVAATFYAVRAILGWVSA